MLNDEEKKLVRVAVLNEVVNVIVEALETDGFKHRRLPFLEAEKEEADDFFFEEVKRVANGLRLLASS